MFPRYPPPEERFFEVYDPKSGRKHTLRRVDLWRLTFAAAGSFCSDQTEGMVGGQKKEAFAHCMLAMARGVPTQALAQRNINQAGFPVDEYVERLEIKRAPLPFKGGLYEY